MNPVYIRLITYVLSIIIGMIPASWAGFVTFNEATGMLQISVTGLAAAVAGGLSLSGAVFAKWGVK
ncbi:MAG: hypothetical protein V4712_17770 [Pseudomonadota bacterium]